MSTFSGRAVVRLPPEKIRITIRLDRDIVDQFHVVAAVRATVFRHSVPFLGCGSCWLLAEIPLRAASVPLRITISGPKRH